MAPILVPISAILTLIPVPVPIPKNDVVYSLQQAKLTVIPESRTDSIMHNSDSDSNSESNIWKKVDSDSGSGSKLVKFGVSSGSDSDSGVGIAHLWYRRKLSA